MKMSRVLSMLFVAILLISVVPVMAQTDTEYVVTFGDGVTVYYPEGWSATTDEEDATVLASKSSALYVYLYSLSDLEENSLEPGDVTGTLEAFHTYNMGDQTEAFDANKLVTVTVNDREITYLSRSKWARMSSIIGCAARWCWMKPDVSWYLGLIRSKGTPSRT